VFKSSAYYKVIAWGVPTLAFIFGIMVTGMLTIMAFRLVMLNDAFDNDFFGPDNATLVGSAANLVWMIAMNNVYLLLAKYINNLENHRTESAYEDSLIFKTSAFQFINSYFALFYVAFIKGQRSVSLFDSFGKVNPTTEQYYSDACGTPGTEPWHNVNPLCDSSTTQAFDEGKADGSCTMVTVRSDCTDELAAQMLVYAAVRPAIGILIQSVVPWATATSKRVWQAGKDRRARVAKEKAKLAEKRLRELEKKKRKDAEAAGLDAEDRQLQIRVDGLGTKDKKRTKEEERQTKVREKFDKEVVDQYQETKFQGTFSEYNDKVIQFGYVCLFSGAFPLAPLIYTFYNAIELRTDAKKVVKDMRRPRYAGAESIGKWLVVIKSLAWLAIPVNVGIMCMTDLRVRDSIFIPLTSSETCYDTDVASYRTPYAVWHGQNTSWQADCTDNYKMCFAELGAVEWLPGKEFLFPNSTTTLDFTEFGVCNTRNPALYSEVGCHLCRLRVSYIDNTRYLFLLIVLLVFIAAKFLINHLIPDVPREIENARAREAERMRKEKEGREKAAEGGKHSALKLAKLLDAHKTPPETLHNYTLRTLYMDDAKPETWEPRDGESLPTDPADLDNPNYDEEVVMSESWM